MHGNVFQLHTERKKRGQFQDTLDALKALASTEYKKEIRYLDPLFRKLEEPNIPLPVKPEKIAIKKEDGDYEYVEDPVKMDVYREEVKSYVSKNERLKHTETALYNIAWGQCSRLMKNKLQTNADFEDIEEAHDISSLLKAIRDISHQIDNNISVYESLDDLLKQFYLYRQQPNEDNAMHLKRFKEYVDVLEHFGSTVFEDSSLVKYEMTKAVQAKDARASSDHGSTFKDKAKQKYLATCLLRRSNMKVYGQLMRELRDQYLQGHDNYPNTLEKAYSLLQHHSCARRNNGMTGTSTTDRAQQQDRQNPNDIVPGIQHSQQRNLQSGRDKVAKDKSVVRGADGRCNSRILCYHCGHYGHYSDNCPERQDSGSAFTPGYETDTSSLPSMANTKKPAPNTVIKKEQHHMHAPTLT